MKAVALVLAVGPLVSSCDRWGACEIEAGPMWAVELRRSSGSPVQAVVRAAPDGETFVLIPDRSAPVILGDVELSGPHLARISVDGEVVAVAADPNVAPGASSGHLVADHRGGALVTVGGQLVAYDEDLVPRWSIQANVGALDVGANGMVAYLAPEPGGTANVLHALDDDGKERWTAVMGIRSSVHVAADGDVVVHDGRRRWRYAAADGTLIENGGTSSDLSGWWVVEVNRDGVVLARLLGTSTIAVLDANGATRWTRTIVRAQNEPELTPHGDVLILTTGGYEAETVTLLDHATGEAAASADRCGETLVLDVADDGYLVGTLSEGSLRAIARYPLPGQ